MTDVVDAPETAAPRDEPQPPRRGLLPFAVPGWLPIAGVCALVFWLCRSVQEGGHGWGDDFALYINQASGLTDGSLSEVIARNRFAVDNSAYSTFSPYAYPWGFPLLLAPVVAIFDVDYGALKLVPTASFALALFFFHRILRRRVGPWTSLVLVLLVGLNSFYIGMTDTVLSEHTFLLSVMLALWWIDRCVEREQLFGPRVGPLVALGLLASAAFNVRREGAVMLLAVALAQAAHHGAYRREAALARARGTVARLRWVALTPYLAFGASAAAIQLVLPSHVFPRYEAAGGTGLHNVGHNVRWYGHPFAEFIGLKDVGADRLDLLGSETAAGVAMVVVLAGAALGAVWRVWRDPGADLHLVGAVLGIGLLVTSLPFREHRYLVTIVPFVLYFAVQGIDALQRGAAALWRRARGHAEPRRARNRLQVAVVAATALLMVVVGDTRDLVDYHREYDYVHWGPEDPASLEMWDAVERFTDERDVIAFFQARTMSLYAKRRGIQGNSEQMMVERADWYVMVKNSDYIQTPLTDGRAAELGFERMWENSRYVLWQIPDREHAPEIGDT